MMPSLSLVIPARGDHLYLERCLEAVHRQTHAPTQIVVVDSGGSELTRRMTQWWGTDYVRELRRGVAPAASAGYDASVGDVICRLDTDSVPAEDWCSRIVDAFRTDRELDAITGPGHFSTLPAPLGTAAELLYMRAYFSLGRVLAGHPPVFGSNFAMRRSLWMDVRGGVHRSDGRVHDDLDLSLSMPARSRVRVDPLLRVDVSARAVGPTRGPRTLWMGLHTVLVNRQSYRA